MYMHYLYSFYKTYWFLSQERVLKIRTLAFFSKQTNQFIKKYSEEILLLPFLQSEVDSAK